MRRRRLDPTMSHLFHLSFQVLDLFFQVIFVFANDIHDINVLIRLVAGSVAPVSVAL